MANLRPGGIFCLRLCLVFGWFWLGFGWFWFVLVGGGWFWFVFGWLCLVFDWFWLVLVGGGWFLLVFGWLRLAFGWFWLVLVGGGWFVVGFWLVLVGFCLFFVGCGWLWFVPARGPAAPLPRGPAVPPGSRFTTRVKICNHDPVMCKSCSQIVTLAIKSNHFQQFV